MSHNWMDYCMKCGKSLMKRDGIQVQAGELYTTSRIGFLCQDCFPGLLDYLGASMPPGKKRGPFMTEKEIEREMKRRGL